MKLKERPIVIPHATRNARRSRRARKASAPPHPALPVMRFRVSESAEALDIALDRMIAAALRHP